MPVVLGSTSILHPSISYDASGNKIGGASLGWYSSPSLPPSKHKHATPAPSSARSAATLRWLSADGLCRLALLTGLCVLRSPEFMRYLMDVWTPS